MQNENAWQQKNLLMQQAANDALFLNDLHEVNEWFEPVNFETLNKEKNEPVTLDNLVGKFNFYN